jgi:hypothetical protein
MMVFRPGGIVAEARRTYQFKTEKQALDKPQAKPVTPG